MKKTRVLIVDDSAVVRQVLSAIVDSDAGLEVMGAAADPIFAWRRMDKEWPDVIISDVEMPRMDGITFLKQVMAERPTPIVICSSLTEKGARTTLQAMEAGAVEIIAKPKVSSKQGLMESSAQLLDAIKSAAQARLGKAKLPSPSCSAGTSPPKLSADAILHAPTVGAMQKTTERVVALGTSTGGTQALQEVLVSLPRGGSGIVIVQHMPEKFTAAFAERLNRICQIEVKEAQHGDRVLPGRALIAPGGQHMLLKRSGAQYQVEVREGPLVSRHRPSVDVLFRSVAHTAGKNAMGVIMTGMGDDGAAGILEMRQAGAQTLAQDEESSVVYGMPKEAVKRGGIVRSVSLFNIAKEILDFSSKE